MKTRIASNTSAIISAIIITIFVLGLFSPGQVGSVLASSAQDETPQQGGGHLRIEQGPSVHYSIITGKELTFELNVKDAPASAVYIWEVKQQPGHGGLVVGNTGASVEVVYTPKSGYSGDDLFSISVRDEVGDTDWIGVVVTVDGQSALPDQLLNKVESLRSQSSSGQEDRSPLPNNKYFTSEKVVLPDNEVFFKNVIKGPSKPPSGNTAARVDTLDPKIQATAQVLSDVPAFSWVFGCSAVSGSMIAGYYDRTSFPDVYTGPTNGGVIPLVDTGWGTWSDGVGTYPNNPLIASKNGLDGRTIKGSIDDYWVEYGSNEQDPYITGGWAEHDWSDAIGDYMKTSQSEWGNTDGATSFYWNGYDPTPLSCNKIESQGLYSDGTLGVRQFYEARGYETPVCYMQTTDNLVSGGFGFAQYKAEIDSGHPVMIHVSGHTMVGVGYDTASDTIYIHDTWGDYTTSMQWGGSYYSMEMWGVSIVHPETSAVPSNDEITKPTMISDLPSYFVQDVSLATQSPDDPDLTGCGLGAGPMSVWYKYTPPADGLVVLDTLGSNYDTILGVWSGSPGSLNEITCNDDYSSLQSLVAFKASTAMDYYVGIMKYNGGISTTESGEENADQALTKELKADDVSAESEPTLVFHAADSPTKKPYMMISQAQDLITGYDLMPSNTITLNVGEYEDTKSSTNGRVSFDLRGIYDVMPGYIVTLSDGYNTATHLVRNLAFTEVNQDADSVKGTADVGSDVFTYAYDHSTGDNEYTWVTPDTSGDWKYYFKEVDIAPGASGYAEQCDDDANCTYDEWFIPKPYIYVYPQYNEVAGGLWTPNAKITLTINGVSMGSSYSNSSGNVYFYDFPMKIKAGQVIKMTDGTYTRKHTVLNLTVTGFDKARDKISGTALPNTRLSVVAWPVEGYGYSKYPLANAFGTWKASFAGLVDINDGTYSRIWQYDAKGNYTVIYAYLLSKPQIYDPDLNGNTAMLYWSVVRGFGLYKVQVASDAAFTKLVMNNKIYYDTSVEVPNLKPGKTYYWRVKATQELAPKGPWSDVGSFTMP